jgi:hypothetical protein
MSTLPIYALPPGNQWDCNLLELLFANKLYRTGLEFERHESYPDTDGIILIIPGQYWHRRTAELNKALRRYEWVLAIKTGDEENLLDIRKVKHPNVRWWIQTPRPDRDYGDARLFGVGFPAHFNSPVHSVAPSKSLDVFFSGQVTHDRRRELIKALEKVTALATRVEETDGFTRGLEHAEYASLMEVTKIAPAPSGAVSPDSFRLYEALQAHTVPVADDISPVYDSKGYWRKVFPDAPFPIIEDYDDLPGYIEDQLALWPANENRIAAWWMRQKRAMAAWLREDLGKLGAEVLAGDTLADRLTVVIPTSPIPAHPDMSVIEETVKSVRHHLPDCEIIITFDGVRAELEHRRDAYEEYIRRVLWDADHKWGNILPLIFDEHTHQAGMARQALEHILTPLLLYVEADTPLTIDCEIDWQAITDAVLSGEVNHVRLNHEALILGEHKQLMLDEQPIDVTGCPLIRTVQYSQRPHVASVAFYRRVLDSYFSEKAKCFIEDLLHG